MSRYDTLLQPPSTPPEKSQPGQAPAAGPAVHPDAPASPATDQPTDRSTDQSTGHMANRIVARPKAFYITEQLDARLDEAVRYLQTRHGVRKVDRSTVVNAMLDQDVNWSQEALDELVDRVIGQLTSRLTG